jgi:hypothetical protein
MPAPSAQDTCATQAGCCSRQSGRAVLGDVIHRLRQRVHNLEMLSAMLPAQPTHDQDDALYQLAVEMEKR